MCMYQNFNQLLALDLSNQITFKLYNIPQAGTIKISNNSFKVLAIKHQVFYKKHSIITGCFETIMGGWGCYSPGKEQGISEHSISI